MMAYFALLTGLLVGSGYGYIAQRGAFCMNSGFRVAVTQRNTTKVKAYVLAIVSIFAGSAITSLWEQRGMSIALNRQEGLP